MATNKHATIRYHALDRCFSNLGKRYFIEDLIEACNKALYDYAEVAEGIKRRQIFDDIKFMESEQGFSIPLERLKDGKQVYYRYYDRSFSIKKHAISESEVNQLKETLSMLTRFKGMPQFEWIEEMLIRVESTFKLKGSSSVIVGFEHNPYLKGLNHFTNLFNAIQNCQALLISYKGYKQDVATEFVFHPWYLKQYNNRWFLFGLSDRYQTLSNLAIDRIQFVKDSKVKYAENTEIDFEEFFEEVIGVSINNKAITEKVVIKISNELWPYIESKPLHGSQKVKGKHDENVTIELNVQVNHELVALLFSYMEKIEVIEPLALRDKFKSVSETISKKYN
jgi:predicted DNA-binding transcriptional regulator YafY